MDHANERPSPWDTSFEKEFDKADSGFPAIIEWLSGLTHPVNSPDERFAEQASSDDQIAALTESVVSLVVRSPGNREASVGLAEHFRGPLPTRERNALIGLNMHRKQRMISDAIGHRGKFAVLFSHDREFIFGDGFFQNLNGIANSPMAPKILVPLTPSMAVAITQPTAYRTQPRFVSVLLNSEEAAAVNHSVQTYARSELFFRSEAPALDPAFRAEKHLRYSHPDNPIDTFLRSLPGIPDRDRSLDGMFGLR